MPASTVSTTRSRLDSMPDPERETSASRGTRGRLHFGSPLVDSGVAGYDRAVVSRAREDSSIAASPKNSSEPNCEALSVMLAYALFEQSRLNDRMTDADLIDDCPEEWSANEKLLNEILEDITDYPGTSIDVIWWKASCHQRAAALMDPEDPRLSELATSLTGDLSRLPYSLPGLGGGMRPDHTIQNASAVSAVLWSAGNAFSRSEGRSHAVE